MENTKLSRKKEVEEWNCLEDYLQWLEEKKQTIEELPSVDACKSLDNGMKHVVDMAIKELKIRIERRKKCWEDYLEFRKEIGLEVGK